MNHRITLGSFWLVRFSVGLYCMIHFAGLLPYGAELFSSRGILPQASLSPFYGLFPNLLSICDAPWMVSALLLLAVACGICLAIGRAQGLSAIALWWVSASLFDRNPLISNPSLPYLGWMLLALAALAVLRRRHEPWEFPKELFLAAWIVMAVSYSYSGATKLISPSWVDGSAIREVLNNPLSRESALVNGLLTYGDWLLAPMTWTALALELLFAPLALFSRLRPWCWLAMMGMHLSLMSLIRFADLSMAMVLFHLLTFDPGWIRPAKGRGPLLCFYDGECGLCHGFVRFLSQEGLPNGSLQVAPQSGALFTTLRPAHLPDSLAVYEAVSQTWWFRSQAVTVVLQRLGGIWRPLGWLLQRLPSRAVDRVYDGIAKHRRRWLSPPQGACPLIASAWFAPEPQV